MLSLNKLNFSICSLMISMVIVGCSEPTPLLESEAEPLVVNSPQNEDYSFNAENLNGVWLIEEEQFALHTRDGSLPPLLAEANAVYQEHLAANVAGDRMFDRATWCASPGLPRLQLISYPFEIMVDKYYVSFFYEWNRWARLVDMSGSELEYLYPMSLGISKGHFEDDGTFVIETNALMSETTMDSAGLPHSEDLIMTERYRLLSTDLLENHITFEDPNTFSQTWETVVRYQRQPGARIQEHVCLDDIKLGLPAI